MQKLFTSKLKVVSAVEAEDTCFEDTEPPFLPPEPDDPEESERDYNVDRIDDELTLVCRDIDTGYHMSQALEILRLQIRKRELLPISRQQANRLRSRLHLVADALLPFFTDADQYRVMDGLKAAADLVTWWATSKDRRKLQPGNVNYTRSLRARWLQNSCHNISIIDELDESAGIRRGKVVATIKNNAGASK